jgi:hypothetical protein
MSISELRTIGNSILRPEGVMVLKDGTILTPDARGQCARIGQGLPAHGGQVARRSSFEPEIDAAVPQVFLFLRGE